MCATKLLGALLTAAAFFIATNATAAENLAPCTHFGDEYYGLVEARIRRAAPDETLWQATVYPSSTQGEWGIRATRMGDDYELTVVRLDRSLWGTGWAKTGRNEFKRDLSSSPARPRATKHKISARLFTELESAIRRSIEAARVPDETSLANALNIDGVLFRFEVAGSGCGETRPPDWGATEAGKLAAIVLALCNPSDENRIFRMLDELQD
jgi:hypothetical protein